MTPQEVFGLKQKKFYHFPSIRFDADEEIGDIFYALDPVGFCGFNENSRDAPVDRIGRCIKRIEVIDEFNASDPAQFGSIMGAVAEYSQYRRIHPALHSKREAKIAQFIDREGTSRYQTPLAVRYVCEDGRSLTLKNRNLNTYMHLMLMKNGSSSLGDIRQFACDVSNKDDARYFDKTKPFSKLVLRDFHYDLQKDMQNKFILPEPTEGRYLSQTSFL
jgi:hypothetical protein